jgi:hypothetical protein
MEAKGTTTFATRARRLRAVMSSAGYEQYDVIASSCLPTARGDPPNVKSNASSSAHLGYSLQRLVLCSPNQKPQDSHRFAQR